MVKSTIEIDPETIRQIAAVQPRFAVTLVDLIRGGGLPGDSATIYWSPVELTHQDIEWWLKPKEESTAFFDALDRKARRSLRRSDQLIVYEITLEPDSNLSIKTLRLRVIKGSVVDAPYSSLEIRLLASEELNSKRRRLEAKQWQIN
jgi:hypothetical protein